MENIIKKIGLVLITAFLITGCNQTPSNSNTASTNDNKSSQSQTDQSEHPISKKPTKPKVEKKEIVPTLISNFAEVGTPTEKGYEFKLRSQIAVYSKKDKSEIKVMLANTYAQSCTNQNAKLQDGDQKFILTLKNKDSKAINTGEFKKDTDHNFSVGLEAAENAKVDFVPKEDLSTLEITYINDAVIRGKIKLTDGIETIEGEFFAAICKK